MQSVCITSPTTPIVNYGLDSIRPPMEDMTNGDNRRHLRLPIPAYCMSLGHLLFYVTKLKAKGNELFMSLSIDILYMDHVY
jgi:hypothetical protein